ncbi:MAG TPA: prenyltransferase [bacterium]|nr:prenyltransferase [bacterium]
MNRSILKSAIAVTRPRFLLLVPACVTLGIATALLASPELSMFRIVIVLIGAVAAHMSVNALNEYLDFRSGLDFRTVRTPFSGGTGTLPSHPEAAPAALITGLSTLGIALAVGLYVSVVAGWLVWVPALIGVLTIVLYTGPIQRNPVSCLLAPGIGFGFCMVTGTHYALTGGFTAAALAASLIPLFLVSNLLLLNQFPDVEADRTAGRCHFPIRIGRASSARIFTAFLIAPFTIIVLAVMIGLFPRGALAGLFMVIPAARLNRGVTENADNLGHLQPFMGLNVAVTLLTPVLTAVGIYLTR